jgi:hypothetical protein
MGFSSKGMETKERKKAPNPKEDEAEQKKFAEVFSHIEKTVDLRHSQMRQNQAIGKLRKEEAPFEVNEKAVVLALNLSDALSKNPKALDRW